MKETMSLLLATAFLGVGALALYMFKDNVPDDEDNEVYNETEIFENSPPDVVEDYEDQPKVRSRGSKTKRSRKASGSRKNY